MSDWGMAHAIVHTKNVLSTGSVTDLMKQIWTRLNMEFWVIIERENLLDAREFHRK